MHQDELQQTIQGLNLTRLSLLCLLLCLALVLYLCSGGHSVWWCLLLIGPFGLWIKAQLCCLASPVGRGWVVFALLCGLGSVPLSFSHELVGLAFWAVLFALIADLMFSIRVATASGRPDVGKRGWMLIVVPVVLFFLTLVSPYFGIGLLAAIILWLAFYSSFLGQVARALEEPLPSED